MNREAPLLFEAIKYHQEQYPGCLFGRRAGDLLNAYGEVAVCKIAHSQKLAAAVA